MADEEDVYSGFKQEDIDAAKRWMQEHTSSDPETNTCQQPLQPVQTLQTGQTKQQPKLVTGTQTLGDTATVTLRSCQLHLLQNQAQLKEY